MREINGNLFWGMQFAPFLHKTSLDEPLVLSRLFHAKTAQSHTAITSIVILRIAESNKKITQFTESSTKSTESNARKFSQSITKIHRFCAKALK